jgi:Putative zinc-finger
MSMNHRTPFPAPQPLCAVFKPLLPLLVLGKLEAAETDALGAHLADCPFCQAHRREYEILSEAMHRHFSIDQAQSTVTEGGLHEHSPILETSNLLTLEDIMKVVKQEEPPSVGQTQALPPEQPRRHPRRLLGIIGSIAAVLVIAILATALFANLGSRATVPAATSTPPRATCPRIEIAGGYLVPASCTIEVGQALVMHNDNLTGYQDYILCSGMNRQCQPNPDGPAELNAPGGVRINVDQSKSFTFSKPGVYHITVKNCVGTCPNDGAPHPFTLTVTVTAK